MLDDFYGLTGKPFQLTPDPAFYFRSATHRKALSYIGYGLAQGESFVVVTGEAGAGKSTLAAHLAATIDPERMTLARVSASDGSAQTLIQRAADGFGIGIEGRDSAGVLGDLEAFLHDRVRAGRRALLVIDDAHALGPAEIEELQVLGDFHLAAQPLLQILLLAQPELQRALPDDPALGPALGPLRHRVMAAHYLDALERSEIEAYVVHRLEAVGWQGNPAFDQRVFAELHAASRGLPRAINRIAHRLLVLGAVERRTRIDSGMMRTVIDEMAARPVVAVAGNPAVQPIDPKLFDSLLAERDAQIAELQQAVVELSTQRDLSVSDAIRPEVAAMQDQFARIEAKLFEQERAIRQTLTMLIEWIEDEAEPARAA